MITGGIYPAPTVRYTDKEAPVRTKRGLVEEEGKHWWGLSAGTNDDKTINSRRYEQAWFGRGERI